MTRVGRGGTVAGTSITAAAAPPAPAPEPDAPPPPDAGDAEADETPEPEPSPTTIEGGAPATPAPDRFLVVGPALDPLATTRKRARQRLVGRPGGPVAPADPPEDPADEIVDTGLGVIPPRPQAPAH